MKKRALKYTSDQLFYNSLIDILKTPPVPTIHTQVDVNVIDAATGLPLAGVVVTVSRSSKTMTTNIAGLAHYDTCHHGQAVVTANLTGYQPFKGNYNIERSKVNTINISLDKI